MKDQYLCPHCRASLNAKKNIILVARGEEAKNKGLVLMHEAIGNYTVAMSASLVMQPGDLVDFYCPVCNHCLNVGEGENLASLIRIDADQNETVIVISRVFGERCTFQLDNKRQVKKYGDNVRKYLNPEWFFDK